MGNCILFVIMKNLWKMLSVKLLIRWLIIKRDIVF